MFCNQIFFLIVAGGKGLRMDSKIRKQYLSLNNLPVLSHTLLKFQKYIETDSHKIILVIPEIDFEYCYHSILKPIRLEKKIILVSGGKERQDSVANGINFIKTISDNYDKDIVLIHDGVRPFINNDLIESCIKGAIKYGACIPALKSIDTIKKIQNNVVIKTLNRENIYQIQTPQGFALKIIVDAINHAQNKNFIGTDDASIVEFCGHKVQIIKGLRGNIKITTKEDLKIARAYIPI